MRTKQRQPERVGIRFAVDQQQIGLDVALTVARPIATQVMIAVLGFERPVRRQRPQNRLQGVIQRSPVLTPGFAFVIAFEG